MEHKHFNDTKVVFYTYQHEFTNTEKFKEGLQEDYQITELIPAHWIKTKNMKATAFLATFKGKNIPQYISIPGEQAKTKLYEHIPNPIRCNKCQSYGHTEKYCKNSVPICGKCSTPGHRIETCNSASIKCHHCSEPHYAGHRACQKQKEEKAIMTLQVKERLTRREAIQRLDQINPDRHRNYAEVAKTGNRQETANREAEDKQAREQRETLSSPSIEGEEDRRVGNAEEREEQERSGSSNNKRKLNPTNEEEEDKRQKRRNRNSSVEEQASARECNQEMKVNSPSHYTSENNEELRREVEAIYNEQTKEKSMQQPRKGYGEETEEGSSSKSGDADTSGAKVQQFYQIIQQNQEQDVPKFKKVDRSSKEYRRKPTQEEMEERQQRTVERKKERLFNRSRESRKPSRSRSREKDRKTKSTRDKESKSRTEQREKAQMNGCRDEYARKHRRGQ